MPNDYQYIELSFINDFNEIKRQIVNSVAITFLLSEGYEPTDLNSYLESTQYGYNASAKAEGKNQLLRITDINSGKVNWNNVPYCDCDDEKKYLLNKGDILIARTGGTTGKSFLINEVQPHSIFASYLIRLRTNKKCLPEFISIFLNSYVFWSQISELKSGSAQPNVNAEKLKTLSIPDCPVNIQKKIINIIKSDVQDDDDFSLALQERIESIGLLIENNEEIKKELDQQQTYLQLLRQAILQEAVQGKLTKQDPTDEPASELLKRIKAEKEKLIKAGKLKKEKELPPITEDEIPFELPEGWVWCRLGELITIKGGKRVPSGYKLLDKATDHIYIRVTDMKNGTILKDDLRYISKEVFSRIKNYIITKEDLYITIAGTIGQVGEVPELFHNMNLTENAARLIIYKNDKTFMRFILSSGFIKQQFLYKTKQLAQPKLALERVQTTLFPLPPFAEQQRIVAKVQQLQQQLSQLEAQVQQSRQYAQQLLQSVLKEAFEIKGKVYKFDEEETLNMVAEVQ